MKNYKLKLIAWLGVCCMNASILATGAESLDSSPWVGWRKGYECYDRAGTFKEDNQYERALELYTQSRGYFEAIRKHFPDWNKAVIEGRIRLCDEEIAALRKLSGRLPAAPGPGASTVRAAAEPGGYQPSAPPVSSYAAPGTAAGSTGRLYIEMQSELDQYRQRLRNALMEIDALQVKLQQSEARGRDIDGVLRDYRLLQEKYALLEVQYKNALERSARPDRDREKYETQLMELKLANDDALRERRRLEAEITARDGEYAAARREILALRDAAQKNGNETKRLERELELTRARAADRGAAGIAPADESLKLRVSALESELARKDQRIDRLMKLLSEKDSGGGPAAAGAAVHSEMEQELRRLREEAAALRAAGATENELRRRIGDLTAAGEGLKQQLAQAEDKLRQRDREYQMLLTAGKQQSDAAAVTGAELKSLRQRTAELESELKSWGTRYAELDKRHRDRLAADALNAGSLAKARTAAEKQLEDLQKKFRELTSAHAALQRDAAAAQALVKSSRETVIELKTRLLSNEVELRKMAALQKAFDELKAKFDLINQASNSDVLAALNRIPGLEESLKRYEAENRALLAEVNHLKKRPAPAAENGPAAARTSGGELEKIETLLADARAAEARSNQEVAIWGYRQVLARDAAHAEANGCLGRIELVRGNFEEAVKYLEIACQATPGDRRNVNALARALIGKRDYNGALARLKEFKKRQQNRVDAALLGTEALAWSRSGNAAEAEKAFKAVLKLDPGNAEAAYELALMLSADAARRKEAGEFYLMAKEHGGSVDSYLEEVLKSVTGGDQATLEFLQQNVIETLNAGDWSSAEWYLNELDKLIPGDARSRRLRSALMILSGKPAACIQLLKQPAGCDEMLLKAAALLDMKQLPAAEKLLAAAAQGKSAPELTVLKAHVQRQRNAATPAERKTWELLLTRLP